MCHNPMGKVMSLMCCNKWIGDTSTPCRPALALCSTGTQRFPLRLWRWRQRKNPTKFGYIGTLNLAILWNMALILCPLYMNLKSSTAFELRYSEFGLCINIHSNKSVNHSEYIHIHHCYSQPLTLHCVHCLPYHQSQFQVRAAVRDPIDRERGHRSADHSWSWLVSQAPAERGLG